MADYWIMYSNYSSKEKNNEISKPFDLITVAKEVPIYTEEKTNSKSLKVKKCGNIIIKF